MQDLRGRGLRLPDDVHWKIHHTTRGIILIQKKSIKQYSAYVYKRLARNVVFDLLAIEY